jgi:sigma-B regulation protein RsbU (phosphoserine phosphatase)
MDAQLSEVLAMGVYLTMFVGLYDPGGAVVRYASAGHPQPVLIGAGGGPDRFLESSGHVIGAVEEGTYSAADAALTEGDVLLLYTDGVDEAIGADGERYGANRLHACARENRSLPASELAELLAEEVSHWTGGKPLRDDVTILILKCTE